MKYQIELVVYEYRSVDDCNPDILIDEVLSEETTREDVEKTIAEHLLGKTIDEVEREYGPECNEYQSPIELAVAKAWTKKGE